MALDCMIKSVHIGDYKRCQFKDLEEGDFFILDRDPQGDIFIKMKKTMFTYEVDGQLYKTIKNSFCVKDHNIRYIQPTFTCYKMGGRVEFLLPTAT